MEVGPPCLPFCYRIVTQFVDLFLTQQGRIHGYPGLVWVGRGTDIEGHLGIWAGAVGSKRSKTPKK